MARITKKMLSTKCKALTRRIEKPVTLEFDSTYSPYSWQIKIDEHYPSNTNFTAMELVRFIDGFVMGFHWREN